MVCLMSPLIMCLAVCNYYSELSVFENPAKCHSLKVGITFPSPNEIWHDLPWFVTEIEVVRRLN